jgi:hypothetical protein
MHRNVSSKNLKGKDRMGDIGIDGIRIFKRILKKQVWILWLRIVSLVRISATTAANTVLVFRSGRSGQNAQWICSHPLTEVRTVWCVQVSQPPFYNAVTTTAALILTILFTSNPEAIPKSPTLPLVCDNISGKKFSCSPFSLQFACCSYLRNLESILRS